MMENVTIRQVTESDYDGVMAIRRPEEVYYGLDYLPDYFLMILKTTGYKGFAAVINEKIVAFKFACLIDGGTTLIRRSGRVSKQYSGKGLNQMLDKHVNDYYLQFPDLQYFTSTNDDETYFKRMHLLVKEGIFQLVHQRTIIADGLMKSDIPAEIKEVTKNDLVKIFESVDICTKLFHDSRFSVFWVPYRPEESNIPYIYTERRSVFGSNIDSMDSSRSLLTFGSFVVCQSVILYQFDIYGSNTEALPGHLVAHLRMLKKLPHDSLQILFHCDENIDQNHCYTAATLLGLKHCDSFIYRKAFCIERVLNENERLPQKTGSK